MARFSERTNWDLGEGEWAAEVRARRASGQDLLDLTLSNPTRCGFTCDPEALLKPLSHAAALTYDPDPRGVQGAREAVSAYYAGHGVAVDPDAVLLTTSTSEAYSFLFRLLADPGDELLIAEPSYPLFEFLARLDNVALRGFPFFYDFGWWIDFAELERRITPRTRALVLVSPNNPTGHVIRRAERERLEALCARRQLPLIVDEVFLDYMLDGRPPESFAAGPHPCLTFVVSGLSKCAALPQMKVGWLAAFGPEPQRAEALRRLEIIADTFLSMNAPAQLALPAWLGGREAMAGQIRLRAKANLSHLAESDLRFLPVQAGWSVILELPQSAAAACARGLAQALVEEAGVATHPGAFYALAGAHRLVISLIGPSEIFAEGMRTIKLWSESKELTQTEHGSSRASA